MSTTNVTYSPMTALTIEALRASTNAENKLKLAGEAVAAFYTSADNFRAVKKQFEADAIIPALDKKYQGYLNLVIERGDKSEQAEVNRKNKATARGFVASYFSKIEKHAFPATPKESTPREPSLAFVEDLIKLAKKGQKLETAPYNLLKVMGYLNSALKEIGVTESQMTEAE